jgi:hypothetical protein
MACFTRNLAEITMSHADTVVGAFKVIDRQYALPTLKRIISSLIT